MNAANLIRFRHCPFCGFQTKQYANDLGPDGRPTGWVCLIDTKHVLDR